MEQQSRWTPFGKKRRRKNYGSTNSTDHAMIDSTTELPNSPHMSERLLLRETAEPPPDDDDFDVISIFEIVLRMLLLVSFIFWIGTVLPTQTTKAARALEYSFVAWGTILVLRLAILYRDQCKSVWHTKRAKAQFEEEMDEERKGLLNGDEDDELLDPEDDQDPSLSALYIVDTSTRNRAVYNDAESTLPLETEYFSGKMLIFIREPSGGPAYFYGKQRRFEFQFQVLLKKVPEGAVYFGTSLQNPLKLGLMQRTLVNAAMAFCRSSNPDLSYSLNADAPFMAFPVITGMNRVVETLPGTTPPVLGQTIEEASFDGVWKVNHTYTFALWSAYVDFVEWKVLNLPAIRPFSLASILGRQPIEMNLFVNEDTEANVPRVPICKFELCHAEHSGLGPFAAGDDTDTVVDDDLAAGIYVRSEDPLWLKNGTSFCSNGGGFCVLQEQVPTQIVLVTVDRKPHKLIQNGEAVFLKLKITGEPPKYLTIHRGWWLKWVTTAPTVNGYFTIHWDDSAQGNSQYLTFNGTFWLRHRRWSKFRVGVAPQGSATYGGRLLGLHVPEEETGQNDDEGEWLQTLEFQAMESELGLQNLMTIHSRSSNDDDTDAIERKFGLNQSKMDVPALIESMNRQKRTSQHAYAVRVVTPSVEANDAFVRFRTGRDLATAMRMGAKWRNSSCDKQAQRPSSLPSTPVGNDTNGRELSVPCSDGADGLHTSAHSFDISADMSEEDWDVDSEGGIEAYESFDDADDKQKSGRTRKNIIGKIARSVKSTTSSAARSTGHAGKRVVSQSVNAGKATVNVGKAMLPIRSKKPPVKEPKSAKRASRRQRQKDLRVAVSSRSMKRASLLDDNIRVVQQTTAIAGELTAQEQSCRTVSSMVMSMSSLPNYDPSSATFSGLLNSLVNTKHELDKSFLQGGAVEVGITVGDSEGLLKGCLVARGLWESHWREEWIGLYKSRLVFYAPLSTEPCLEIPFDDVRMLRLIDTNKTTPLAGFPVMVVETLWVCHYFAFGNVEIRQKMFDLIEEAYQSHASTESNKEQDGAEMDEARFWQGFEGAQNFAKNIGSLKWAHVLSSNAKQKSRVILNNRRLSFDYQNEKEEDFCSLIEKSLALSLSFTMDSMRRDPDRLALFLDQTSQLRNFPLESIDLSSPDAFCLFVNLYHCLLQHALLFSANGPIHKKSFRHFMRTSCYEVGGDVFSLAELYCCVIRGSMCRSQSTRTPYMDIAKRSDAYRSYGLPYRCAAVNLLLHTGEITYPETVPILNPIELEIQLDRQAIEFLQRNVTVDEQRKTIFLPKLLDVYRPDFLTEADSLLDYVVVYVNERTTEKIQRLVEEDVANIKFQFPTEQFYADIKSNQDVVTIEDETKDEADI